MTMGAFKASRLQHTFARAACEIACSTHLQLPLQPSDKACMAFRLCCRNLGYLQPRVEVSSDDTAWALQRVSPERCAATPLQCLHALR